MSDITGQENVYCGGCGSTWPYVHYIGCPKIRYDTGGHNNTVTNPYTGWICPRCNMVNAPHVTQCTCTQQYPAGLAVMNE